MRSLVLLLHQALLGASATGPYLFFRPSSGHLYLSGQARELPIYRSVQRYQHSLEISVAQPFLFPPTHFFGLRNLYRACMLNLGYHWTGYLFYRLKKSSRHKVRTWHFTHAYRLPPIESPYPLLPTHWEESSGRSAWRLKIRSAARNSSAY